MSEMARFATEINRTQKSSVRWETKIAKEQCSEEAVESLQTGRIACVYAQRKLTD